MFSTNHSSDQIQAHLYQSFLSGQLGDVSLKCTAASWSAVYSLHRVVLIQAGFFRSLFTSGFRESVSSRNGNGGDVIDLRFDDPNITRAAFEICVARLYGGGPSLWLPPDLIATVSNPLTPPFPQPPTLAAPPIGEHLASPRFLLSLIATGTYLSMPGVTSEALHLIMQSIGPFTVKQYLDFAIGKGIGEQILEEPIPATGLELIGKDVVEVSRPSSQPPLPSTSRAPSLMSPSIDEERMEFVEKSQGMPSDEEDSTDERPSILTSASRVDGREEQAAKNDRQPCFSYGSVGNQIGEACASWLCRWGLDMLRCEEAIFAASRPSTSSSAIPNPITTQQSLQDLRNVEFPPFLKSAGSGNVPNGMRLVIWAPKGLSVRWIRGLISSDTFFAGSELQRYRLAVRVYRFRNVVANEQDETNPKMRDEDEKEWDELFRTGVYYSHMTFEELREIEKDRIVPLQTLAHAHWTHSIFRGVVTIRPQSSTQSSSTTARSASPPLLSPSSAPRELGIVRTTAEIKAALENSSLSPQSIDEEEKTYFPVLADGSLRMGDYLASGVALSGVAPSYLDSTLFAADVPPVDTGKIKTPRRANDESTFFGIVSSRRTARMVVQEDPSGAAKWTEFEPFRFSAEWWGVESLKEKARMHSITVSYAGSWYNVYVQVVRRKGLQLGLYLHRQSMVDPIPVASSPPGGRRERSYTSPLGSSSLSASLTSSSPTTNDPSAAQEQLQISTRVGLFTGAVSSSPPTPAPAIQPPPTRSGPSLSTSGSLPNIGSSISTTYTSYYRPTSPINPGAPSVQYRDPRSVVRAYFSINCPSATGTSMTQFSSGPDDFGISQSWGWKSSTCLEIPVLSAEEEGIGGGRQTSSTVNEPSVAQWLRELKSVRATVLIGVV